MQHSDVLDLQIVTILKHNEPAAEDWIAIDLQLEAHIIDIQIVLKRAVTIRVVHARISQYIGWDLEQKISHRHAKLG